MPPTFNGLSTSLIVSTKGTPLSLSVSKTIAIVLSLIVAASKDAVGNG